MTELERKFVAEYLLDQNGTQAAKRAGFKGSENALGVRAHELLRKSKIRAAVDAGLKRQNDEILARVAKKTEAEAVSKERLIERLSAIAFSDIGEAFQPDANGKLTMTIQQMKASGFSKLIRKMKVLPGGKVEVDLHSVLPAIEMIAKMNGWIKEIHHHEGEIGTPAKLTEDQFKRIFSDPKAAEAALVLAESIVPPAGKPAKEMQ